jgi:hypothetical protein
MKKHKTKIIVYFLMTLLVAGYAMAAENETTDTVVQITGNIPQTTIFLDEAGGDGLDDSITLVENSTQLVSCWGVASDLDGLNDLANLNVTLFAESSDRFAALNDSINYVNDSCDISTWTTDGAWNCTFPVQYFAENSTWTCTVNITNTDPQYYNDTANDTAAIEDLIGLEINTTLVDFGLRAVEVNYNASDEVRIFNTGNVEIDLQLDAFNRSATFDDDDANSFNCTIGNISVNNLRFSLVFNQSYAASTPMVAVGATATEEFNLLAREGGAGTVLPTWGSTYWAIGIPPSIAGVCTGQIMYIGVASGP